MLKRVISLILICILVSICSSALCEEEFTLHNGTQFGMTIEEVIEKEKESKYEIREMSCFVYDDETAEMKEKNIEGLIVYGSVAGISGSTILYHFNSEGRLFEEVYFFGRETEYINYALSSRIVNYDDKYGNYEILKTALQDKYKDAKLQASDDDPIVSLINKYIISEYGRAATIKEEEAYRIQVSDLEQVYILHVWPTYSNTVYYGTLGYQIQNISGDYIVYRLVPNEEVSHVNNAKQIREEQEKKDTMIEEERKTEERNNDL